MIECEIARTLVHGRCHRRRQHLALRGHQARHRTRFEIGSLLLACGCDRKVASLAACRIGSAATHALPIVSIHAANFVMKSCKNLRVDSFASFPLASKSLSAPPIYASGCCIAGTLRNTSRHQSHFSKPQVPSDCAPGSRRGQHRLRGFSGEMQSSGPGDLCPRPDHIAEAGRFRRSEASVMMARAR